MKKSKIDWEFVRFILLSIAFFIGITIFIGLAIEVRLG